MATYWYWRCVLLVIIVCLNLILITYFNSLFLNETRLPLPFQNTTKEISRFSKTSTHPYKYLDKDCYHYDGLQARFICDGPYFNFTKERIFDCAWKLWNTKRNPKEVDSWQNKTAHANVSASEVAKRPSVRFMFVGDSHIRHFAHAFMKRIINQDTKFKVGNNTWEDIHAVDFKKTRDMELIHLYAPLRITFKWDPLLEKMPSYLTSWITGKEPRPTFLMFDTSLHYMVASTKVYLKSGPKKASEKYANHLKVLAPLVKEFAQRTPSVFKLTDHLQDHPINIVTNNDNIDLYNDIARKTLAGDNLVLWDSAQPLSDLYNEECHKHNRSTPETKMWNCEDKRHVGYVMLKEYLDLYFNAICNT